MASVVEAWLNERRRRFGLQVAPTSLPQCEKWQIIDGELRHVSGRFFQVVGARAITPAGGSWEQPLLRQEEVGLLAFLVREADGRFEWLLQAKAEPGNVGGTQIAPTIQATESNFQRVHGGAATRFLEWFASDGDEHVVADVVASEIGTRFLRKRNRNAVALVPRGRRVTLGGAWEWFPSSELRSLLALDYAVGTEARSVIASAPWTLIADGTPFSRWHEARGFRGTLVVSHEADADVSSLVTELEQARASASAGAHEIPLDDLRGWKVDDRGIHPERPGSVSVRYVWVAARDREVGQWCQPLMERTGTARADLVCQRRDGVLRFLLRTTWEPGLAERIELGPSRLVDDARTLERPGNETTRLSMLQSDEGGRFLNCRTRYRIVERRAEPIEPPRAGEHWVTLAQLETLAHRPTTLTNETRTLISMLLSLA